MSLRKSSLLCSTVLILLLSLVALTTENTTLHQVDTQETEGVPLIHSYIPSGPILIQSDSDFETQGWPGNGTDEEPYLIWNLAVNTDDYCIHIENTTAHYLIAECNLTRTISGPVVFMRNVTNGRIESTIIRGGDNAVRLWNVSSVALTKCEMFSTNLHGVWISQASSVSLSDCKLLGGVGVSDASDCSFVNNSITDIDTGFQLNDINNCMFSFNNITNAVDWGFTGTATSCNFTHNTISGSEIGLYITGGEDNLIARNNLYQNHNGMQIDSKGTVVVGNRAWNNSGTGIVIASITGNITVQSNLVSATDGGGLYITSTNIQVLDNIVEGDGSMGHSAYSVEKSDVTFVNNTCHKMWYGFQLGDGVQNCQMIRNHLSDTRVSFYLIDDFYCSLIDNDITGGDIGIIVDTNVYSSETLIMGNKFNGTEKGISVSGTWNANITQNEFYDILQTGIYIQNAIQSPITNNSVFGAGKGGFWIDDSPGMQILNNHLVDASILLTSSGGTVLENNELTNGGLYISGETLSEWSISLSNNLVNGLPIGYLTNVDDLDVDLSDYGQCFILSSSNSTFHDGNFLNTEVGVSLAFSDNCSIQSCTVTDSKLGMFLCNVTEVIVNDIRCTGMAGLWDWYAQVYTGTGIMILNSEKCELSGITCEYGEDIGASVLNSRLCRFDSCEFIRNNWGVYIESDNCTIVDCLIRLNNVGIKIPNSYSIGNHIYYNRFELNNQTNAIDDARPDPQNIWDDGVSMGNFWSDYSGSGQYVIDGYPSKVDRYPYYLEVKPILNHPGNLEYDEGTTGHVISWSAIDTNPAEWRAYRNGTLFLSGIWDSSIIELNVDGLDPDTWNITLLVIDEVQNQGMDTVFVTVIDIIAPIIDHPSDIEFEELETGHSLVWTPYDSNPLWYTIYLNGTEYESNRWNGSAISVSLDGLSPGLRNYTIVVEDGAGASVSDSVMVLVHALAVTPTTTTSTTPTTSTSSTDTPTTESSILPPPPNDFDPMLVILLGGGVAGAIVLIVVFVKTRKN